MLYGRAVISADANLDVVVQMQQTLTLWQGIDGAHFPHINDSGTVNSDEILTELCFKVFHGGAQNMDLAISMNAHIVPRRIDPLDVLMGQ